jgi:hypothetical protein
LSGSAGFDTAGTASPQNGEIILSAGHNVSFQQINSNRAGTGDASIIIDGGNYSSTVRARAATDFFASSFNANTTFQRDLIAFGGNRAHVGARNARTVTIGGNVSVNADRGQVNAAPVANGVSVTGGQALIYADGGGTLNITGNASASAQAVAGFSTSGPRAVSTGGEAQIYASAGTVNIGGTADVNASANFSYGFTSGMAGPDGVGGTATLGASKAGNSPWRAARRSMPPDSER